jgi:hypothetical protein
MGDVACLGASARKDVGVLRGVADRGTVVRDIRPSPSGSVCASAAGANATTITSANNNETHRALTVHQDSSP